MDQRVQILPVSVRAFLSANMAVTKMDRVMRPVRIKNVEKMRSVRKGFVSIFATILVVIVIISIAAMANAFS